MNELAEALKRRGFLIDVKDDHIYFCSGNHESELRLLERLFYELNIKATINGRKIYLREDISEEILTKVIWYPARNHEAGGGSGWMSWKYFKKRKHGPKINTFSLETGVALLVKALSAAGMVTNCSCDGHGKRAPVITFCGHHNAIWFDIFFKEVKDNFHLHYDWYIYKRNNIDVDFGPKGNNEYWDLEKILKDTLQIAVYFLANSEKLSSIKRQIFGSNYKTNRKIVHSMDYDQLSDWMKTKFHDYIKKSGEPI